MKRGTSLLEMILGIALSTTLIASTVCLMQSLYISNKTHSIVNGVHNTKIAIMSSRINFLEKNSLKSLYITDATYQLKSSLLFSIDTPIYTLQPIDIECLSALTDSKCKIYLDNKGILGIIQLNNNNITIFERDSNGLGCITANLSSSKSLYFDEYKLELPVTFSNPRYIHFK